MVSREMGNLEKQMNVKHKINFEQKSELKIYVLSHIFFHVTPHLLSLE